MTTRAFVTGLQGRTLGADEAVFLRQSRPAGVILFARNIDEPDQVRKLVSDACAAIGSDILVLVDQEGGRVQRLRPPHWRALPSGAAYAAVAAVDFARAVADARSIARLVAHDLAKLGINANCTPVLDLAVSGAHDVIGSRALGRTPALVAALGRAIADAHLEGGVLPIMKHMPGHGRVTLDTHLSLPTVAMPVAELEVADFAPFKMLAHLPAGMTAHIVFSDIDPATPASTSKVIHHRIIRGFMGFAGLLFSDDLGMQALSGTPFERAAAVLAAGTDIALHCNGSLPEMEQVAAAAPELTALARERFDRAIAVTRHRSPFDVAAAESALQRVSAGIAAA